MGESHVPLILLIAVCRSHRLRAQAEAPSALRAQTPGNSAFGVACFGPTRRGQVASWRCAIRSNRHARASRMLSTLRADRRTLVRLWWGHSVVCGRRGRCLFPTRDVDNATTRGRCPAIISFLCVSGVARTFYASPMFQTHAGERLISAKRVRAERTPAARARVVISGRISATNSVD
jgi:hypothetical protein